MSENSKVFYEFGSFRLDERERRFLRADEEVTLTENGKAERLTPKAFDLLLVLIKQSGKMVGRDELMERIWPGTYVEDNRLSDNISTLRKFLGDPAKNSKYIETIPKHGYRFVAEVREVRDETIALVEETRAHIVIEEEDSAASLTGFAVRGATRAEPLTGTRAPIGNKILWLTGGILTAGVLVGLLWTGAALVRSFRSHRAVAAPPLMKTIQLTSLIDMEFDAVISPDGKLVAYSRHDGQRENIFVKQVGASESLQLTHVEQSRNGSAAWSPDGLQIAFLRIAASGSGIFTVPSLGGAERKLYPLEQLRPNAGLDWSPDGKYIAFTARASVNDPFSIHLLSLETLDVSQLTFPSSPSHIDSRMEFSPDGKTVAFVRGTTGGEAELYLVPATGGEVRRLTFENRGLIGLSWTPDGGHIVFSSNRAGGYALWKIPSGGGTLEPVPLGGENAIDPHISRGGNRLVFTKISIDSNIWRIRLPDEAGGSPGPPKLLISSSRHDRNPTLSPDGKSIAFESSRTGNSEIWMTDAEGANPVQLTSLDGPVTGNPSWSPDGRQITFESRPEGHADIYAVSVAGGVARRLTTDATQEVSPSWSRDGLWIYFCSDRGGAYQLWKMPSGGGAPVQVTQNGGYEVVESEDSQFIYYTKYRTPGIYRLPVAGGAETLALTNFPELGSWGDWLMVNTGLYFIDRDAPSHVSIRFLDFATTQVRPVVALDKDPGSDPGLTLSADGHWLIYSKDDSVNCDLMVVENFR